MLIQHTNQWNAMRRQALCLKYIDWLADTRVRCCSAEERGVWIELLMHMSQAERPGVLEKRLDQIAKLVGSDVSVLHALIENGLLKGQESRGVSPRVGSCTRLPFVGQKAGIASRETVTLLEEVEGPLYFCDWMVEEAQQAPRFDDAAEELDRGVAAKPEAAVSWASVSVPAEAGASTSAAARAGEEPDEAGSGADGEEGEQADAGRKVPNCPQARLVALFHEMLPTAKRVVMVGPGNQLTKALKARWRALAAGEDGPFTGYTCVEDGLKKWAAIFTMVGRSKFLTGRVPNRNGDAPFELSLIWLVGPKNMEKVLNGFYHRDAEEKGAAAGDGTGRSAMAERVMQGVERVMEMQRGMSAGQHAPQAQAALQLETLPL